MSRQLLEFDRLTRREEEVLSALMRGAKARDICVQSFVSMPTVRSQNPFDPHKARCNLAIGRGGVGLSERLVKPYKRGAPDCPPGRRASFSVGHP